MAAPTHIFLSKVNKVLKVDIVPVGFDVAVDEEIKLVSDPVLEDKGQDSGRQLHEEDEAEEHRELEHMDGRHWRGMAPGDGEELPTTSAEAGGGGGTISSLHPPLVVCRPPSPAGGNPEPCVC